PLLGVVGDAVVPVNLLPQELGHRRMEPEALGEPDDRRILRPQGVEQALVHLVLAERAPGLGLPIVLGNGRHLPVAPIARTARAISTATGGAAGFGKNSKESVVMRSRAYLVSAR